MTDLAIAGSIRSIGNHERHRMPLHVPPEPSDASLFDRAYDQNTPAYGNQPSSPLAAFLRQANHQGTAFDLGAGAGRDTLALAIAGYDVDCFDLSEKGLELIQKRARDQGVESRIKTHCIDVREIDFGVGSLDLIVATTVLDHIPLGDAETVWRKMTNALNDRGVIYVEVHTTDDPGCSDSPRPFRNAPISETASAVVNYFPPHQLASWTLHENADLRMLHYEERLEWDKTHGPEHLHGKAILLAERRGSHRLWQGELPVDH